MTLYEGGILIPVSGKRCSRRVRRRERLWSAESCGAFWERLQRRGRPSGATFSAFLLCALLMYATGAGAGERIVVAGSGTNLPGMRMLAASFHDSHPSTVVEIPSSLGSTGGVRAAADGAISLALISRPLRKSERSLGLTVRPYAVTALVIGAGPAVEDVGITSRDLVAIFEGKKSRWKNGSEIVVLTRQPEDSTIVILSDKIPGFRDAFLRSEKAKRWYTLFTDQDMNKMLVRTPYAIGFSDMGSIVTEHLAIRVLRLDGVYPSLKNIENGSYPLTKTLSFAYRKDQLSPSASAFMDFCRSREGKRIMRQGGYLPTD